MAKRGFWSVVATVILLLVGLTAFSKTLLINEVAWAGSAASSTDEWIELYNLSDEAVDLTGWVLALGERVIPLGEATGSTKEVRRTVVAPADYFLLERTDDTTVSEVEADLIYAGSLANSGVAIRLLDPDGGEVDTANVGQEGWAGGSGSSGVPPYATMERIDPAGPDLPHNWATNNGVIRCGLDANGEPLNGTPAAKNSATIVAQTVPVVEVLSPLEGEKVQGKLTITWRAIDPDGLPEQLRIDIALSSDAGATWQPLIEGLANTGVYTCDPSTFPGGKTYQLRVVATDNAGLAGEGVGPPFTIAGEP